MKSIVFAYGIFLFTSWFFMWRQFRLYRGAVALWRHRLRRPFHPGRSGRLAKGAIGRKKSRRQLCSDFNRNPVDRSSASADSDLQPSCPVQLCCQGWGSNRFSNAISGIYSCFCFARFYILAVNTWAILGKWAADF